MRAHAFGMVEREGKGRKMEHRLTDARIKQTDIRCQLGGSSHCAPQVIAHLLLIYHNRRGEVLYLIHVGSRQLGQTCPGKRTESLNKLTLSLSIYRVEEQRRLAATAHSRKHDDAVFGQFNVDIFKIVGVCVLDDDIVSFHICQILSVILIR